MFAAFRRCCAGLVCAVEVVLAGAIAGSSPSDIVWQLGTDAVGDYRLPSAANGQCPGVGPVIDGHDATFTVRRNTSGSYTYNGRSFARGASTCYRNQLNPLDHRTGENFLLRMGARYIWTFRTVVNLNGNQTYRGAADGGLAVDIPAIVWQTHSYGGSGEPCDLLVIQNTYVAYANGITKYGVVPQGGRATWNFHTCAESDFTGAAYNSPDVLHDGEIDDWKIEMTAGLLGKGGSVTVVRNGTRVYDARSPACDASTPACWWNFGPYLFFWRNTEEPPGWNDAGVTVRFRGMTLREL